MNEPRSPNHDRSPPRSGLSFGRRPAVPVVLALAAGICWDRYFDLPMAAWLWGGSGLWIAAALACRFQRSALPGSLLLLAGIVALGGARHHQFWSLRGSDDVSAFASVSPEPVRLVGVIESSVEIVRAEQTPSIPSWMRLDHSRCLLRCEFLDDAGLWRPVSGRVRLDVDGHLVHAGVGDRVEVWGRLSRPGPPPNPGRFDFRQILRGEGADGTVRSGHPAAVMRLDTLPGAWWRLARWREGVRAECNSLFVRHLSQASQAVAGSLLLGDRTLMTDELRTRFTESGTMHLLAISGLHVGILLGLMYLGCRLLNLSNRRTALVLVLLVLTYALLTNHRPPVLRATLLATLALIGMARARSVNGMNTLAVTATLLLLWKPADLFDIGAQLSFLAVGAILWIAHWPWLLHREDPMAGLPAPERALLLEKFAPAGRWLLHGYLVTGGIWFATLPLTMATFHLAAPVGFFLNVLLIPFIALVLSLGYLFLVAGLLLPILGGPFGAAFDWSLQTLLGVVGLAQSTPGGHFYLAQIPLWWVSGFYVLLGFAWQLWGTRRTMRWGCRLLLVWIALGLAGGTSPARDGTLRCTFLSVGHGLATVLELPGGETVLFDAGTIGDGRSAERAVADYLWSRNIDRIDAIVLSHADHDHYSGVFGLLEKMPVGTLFIARSFLDFGQPGVRALCEAAARARVPIRIVQAGDRLVPLKDEDRETELEVVHPAGRFRSEDDNANSVVLEIRYAGRRILLTGDVEKEGLDELLSRPIGPIDILLSPHHGGVLANPPAIYEWAAPEYVVVSTARDDAAERLAETVRPARLLSTRSSGAVTFAIRRDGGVSVDEFLAGARGSPVSD